MEDWDYYSGLHHSTPYHGPGRQVGRMSANEHPIFWPFVSALLFFGIPLAVWMFSPG